MENDIFSMDKHVKLIEEQFNQDSASSLQSHSQQHEDTTELEDTTKDTSMTPTTTPHNPTSQEQQTMSNNNDDIQSNYNSTSFPPPPPQSTLQSTPSLQEEEDSHDINDKEQFNDNPAPASIPASAPPHLLPSSPIPSSLTATRTASTHPDDDNNNNNTSTTSVPIVQERAIGSAEEQNNNNNNNNNNIDDKNNTIRIPFKTSSLFGVQYKEYDTGANSSVNTACFSPDGTLFLHGGENNNAQIVECTTGIVRHTFDRDYSVRCASFSPDGRRVIIGGWDKKAIIYDVRSGQIIETLERGGWVRTVLFSHHDDGRYILVGGYDRLAVLYKYNTHISSYEEVRTFDGVGWAVDVAVFSNDCSLLAIGGENNKAIIYDVDTGESIQTFMRDDAVIALAISSDNCHIIVGGRDKNALLYELSSGKLLYTFERSDSITCLAFDPSNDRIVIGLNDGLLDIIDATTFQTLYSFHPGGGVYDASFSRDGKELICGACGKVVIYNIPHGQPHCLHSGKQVSTTQLSNDGSLILTVLGDDEKTAILQDTASGNFLSQFSMDYDIRDMCFSGDGKKVVIGSGDYSNGQAKIFDVSTGILIYDFPNLDKRVWAVSISLSSELALAGGWNETVVLFNLSTCQEEEYQLGFVVYAVAFSYDSKRFIVGGTNVVMVYDIDSKEEIQTIHTESIVTALSFSKDDTHHIFIRDGDGKASLYNYTNGNILQKFQQNDVIHSTNFFNNKFYASRYGDRVFTVRKTDTSEAQLTFLSPSSINKLTIATNTNTSNYHMLGIATRTGSYILPIYASGPSCCFLPVDYFLQAESSIDLDLIKLANQHTMGTIQLQRGSDGMTLLHSLAKKGKHNLMVDLITPFPDKIFSSRSSREETTTILNCLVKHHHLDTLKLIIKSASLNPSTPIQHCLALTSLMMEFVELGNINMAVMLAKISCNGFLMVGFYTYIQDEDGRPQSISAYQSSPTWEDRQIWNALHRRDEQKRICHTTGMVAIPGLADFQILSKLLSLESNDIFQCASVQTTILSHWDGWARRFFLIQTMMYLVWFMSLFWLNEISRNDRLYVISSGQYDNDGSWYYSSTMRYSMLALVSTGIIFFSFVQAKQASVMGTRKYVKNGWNVRQCISLLLATIFTITSQLPKVSPIFVSNLSALNIFMNGLGILYYMRVSDGFAWIIYSLIRILSGLRYFIVVTVTIIFTYTCSYRAMYWKPTIADEYEDSTGVFRNFDTALETVFFASLFADFNRMVLWETSSGILSWFLMATLIVFVTIVALNALIAYSGDIFDRLLEERSAVLIRIKAECIVMSYCLMPKRMRKSIEAIYKWTYRLIPPGSSGDDNAGSGGDRRKEDDPMFRRANKMDIKEMKNELKTEIDEKLGNVKSEIKGMKNEVEERLKKFKTELKEETDARFDKLEKKMDKILELLERK